MCGVRVYLPTTLSGLAARLSSDPGSGAGAVAESRAVVADAGVIGYAVTPALREWYREGDLEELEYIATTHAARASLRLLAREIDVEPYHGSARRVVLAVDVPDAATANAADVDVAAVRVGTDVVFEMLAAVHVDDPAAAQDVAAAVAVADAASAGDDDARFIVDGVDDHELQWYAVQEIPQLLG